MLDDGAVDGAGGDPAYAEAGFIKYFHGVILHRVLVLPALAALLRRFRLPEAVRVRIVTIAVGVCLIAAAAVLAWSLAGQ
jgi:hypothetical protein